MLPGLDRYRIIAMIISTVLACWGQLIYLQNMGTFSTYGAYTSRPICHCRPVSRRASVQSRQQASYYRVILHTLFIVAPQAGQELFAMPSGEYFRVFSLRCYCRLTGYARLENGG